MSRGRGRSPYSRSTRERWRRLLPEDPVSAILLCEGNLEPALRATFDARREKKRYLKSGGVPSFLDEVVAFIILQRGTPNSKASYLSKKSS